MIVIASISTLALAWFFYSQFSEANRFINTNLSDNEGDGGSLVPRIVQSGRIANLDDAISKPDITGWKEVCVAGVPCVMLPPDLSLCESEPGSAVVVNTSSCGADSESIMLLSKVESVEPAALVIPQTKELVARAFQNISDDIVGRGLNGSSFCLDDLQMRHCVVSLNDGSRYLLRGDFYFDQQRDRIAFDGVLRLIIK